MPEGTALVQQRVERFDSLSSILYAPVLHQYPTVAEEIDKPLPEEAWVAKAFREFVRGEFGKSLTRPQPSAFGPRLRGEEVVGLEYLREYLGACEERFVYSGLIDSLRRQHGADTIGAMFDILCDPNIGHRKNAKNILPADFRRSMEAQLTDRDRLLFVLPSFPFKDQNRFRTYSAASTVDLGEINLLARLHCLALALYQVHPFGADIVILSDGLLYAEIFGIELSLARRYREQLRGFRNYLNIQGTVSILDLSDLLARFSGPVSTCRARIKSILSGYERRDDELGQTFQVLTRGMKWNLSTRDTLAHLNDEDAWRIMNANSTDEVPAGMLGNWESLEERARVAAHEYASVNLSLRYLDLLARVFPRAFRGTVHPKTGQFAIPVSGGLYPWNGVAAASGGHDIDTDVRTRALYELAGQTVDLVRLDASGEPLFFRV